MTSALEIHLAEISALCRQFGVARLEVFGSATRNDFNASSDIDLLVEWNDDLRGLFGRFFGLKGELERVFGRRVDLVSAGGLSNPYFIEAVDQSRQLLYAAEDAQAA